MKSIQYFIFILFPVCVALVTILFVNVSSIVSLLFYSLLFIIVWRIVLQWSDPLRGLGVFFFYAVLAVCLYEWQLLVIPGYFGFSGGLGVGTDDSYFYSLAAMDLPADFPVREYYWLRSHHYSDVLKIFSGLFTALYSDSHPLDLILFNVLGLSLVPFFSEKVAFLATNDSRTARFTFWTTLICPFLLANGLILIRDGWIAMLYIGAFYFLMTRQYLLLVGMLLGTFFLRMESGLLLMFSVVLYGSMVGRLYSSEIADVTQGWRSVPIILAILTGLLILGIFVVAVIGIDQIGVMAITRFYRVDFLESFIAQTNGVGGGGTFYKINQLPWFFSIPLGCIFFLGSPFFTVRELMLDGNFIPRMLLANLFSIMFIWYFVYFSSAMVRILKGSNSVITILAFIFLIDVLVLSQASMQIRHKIALMPLFYVILGYGYVYRRTISVVVGSLFVSISVVLVNMVAIVR